jgi:FAD:protein FMN transferase
VRGSALSIAGLALVSALTPVIGATSSPAPVRADLVRVETSAPHMGTLVRIVLYAPSTAAGEAAAQAAFARIAEIDARLSDYRDDSEVAALSRAAAQVVVPISRDLFAVLKASQKLARRTSGAFDVTQGRLTHLWRRARRLNVPPDATAVTAAHLDGGYTHVGLDQFRRTVQLDLPGIVIDAGGIAKGYAAEEALRVLRARDSGVALVAIAGDIAAGDPPPGQSGWRIAIPRLGSDEPYWIAIANAAVSTSGDAEQWMTVDGVRRSHIIDLRTGWPVTGRTSVSVVAAHGIDADALSTTLDILDADAGARLLIAYRGPDRPRRLGAQALWQHVDDAGTVVSHHSLHWPALAARDESPTAFDGRCIPALGVARRLNIPDIRPPHALIAGRLARLGAACDFHHGLLARPISAITLRGHP